VTASKADAAVVWRHRRVYRRGYYGGSYYAHPDGLGGYPYSASHYAYRHVWAPPVFGWGWGRHRGWRW
jgi:hypothetical protein